MPTRLVLLSVLVACGGGSDGTEEVDPTDVRFGDTALVIVMNPVINDANKKSIPAPGPALQAGVVLRSDDGIADTTGSDGIAVLAPLTAGLRTITIEGGGIDASFTVMLGAGELREIAVSANAGAAQVMLDIDYKTDRVFEVTPDMPNSQVNDALGVSDRVVFLKGGVYAGDLEFKGSRVTLFGEGVLGGAVTLQGNIAMTGSDSRIRGALVTGNLTIPASGTGLSFSRVEGSITATGSDATLLGNQLCGADSITGSGAIVVGNLGMAPSAGCL
jgi:hypothetical protein